jgi:glycoprotein endo-alpha-1,2-mannosidase
VNRFSATAAAVVALLVAQLGAVATYQPAEERTGRLERAAAEATADRPLVGAHYHLWYPSNFDQGFLRPRLVPPQEPAMGRYSSAEPAVAEQQIAWASAHGVDFFTIDWWPTRPEQNENAMRGFMQAENIGDISFAVFYETWDLGFVETQEATPMTPAVIDRFVADMDDLATRFFDHPSYLRIGGRPVVILYLSRTMTGDVAGAIALARERLRASGHDVFFVGDEVFWRPLNPDRMRLFDAITAYNLYEHEKQEHRGYPADTSIIPDQIELYRRHAEAVDGQVPVVPAVLPGYNDRGVRPSLGHYAIPRRWSAADPEGSTLRQMITLLARPLVDPRAPMLFVTSWNEWNEDTAIEPLAPAPETARDESPSGSSFTEGYAYGGGDLQLKALRDEVVAVAGVVTDDGDPEPGVRVEARQDGRLVDADVTDHEGRYTLSRWLVGEGPVVVTALGESGRAVVTPQRTAIVDLAA